MARSIRLLAHNIRSLWNVGAFFRTADGMHVEHIYLTGYTGTPPRKEITKTAIGADEFVPFTHASDPIPVLEELKKDGWELISLELTKDAVPLKDLKVSDKVCLIVGHELEGVPQTMLELSNQVTMIPMLGQKESLNVAIATGIALHHLRNTD